MHRVIQHNQLRIFSSIIKNKFTLLFSIFPTADEVTLAPLDQQWAADVAVEVVDPAEEKEASDEPED